ncbi:YozE family protein [Virgibacillus sp. MSP4-1]|uniref:YozE family protein n=1 Tax=Virgibacillus sp. MSP4-1 TaxID=2700081 RepID=UPI0003A568CE|nr:YozE family protein [Virgibacillus sp. MSP4-1]QHS22529.1 YozE family protein [Virgibacillus sp. MSP4-1]
MRSFYHFMMKFRGMNKHAEERQLADWMFRDHDFPKHSKSYDEISRYLEWNMPFTGALQVFDQMWEAYVVEEVE